MSSGPSTVRFDHMSYLIMFDVKDAVPTNIHFTDCEEVYVFWFFCVMWFHVFWFGIYVV